MCERASDLGCFLGFLREGKLEWAVVARWVAEDERAERAIIAARAQTRALAAPAPTPAPSPKQDDSQCVVCMDAPRTAILVHGEDGHQVCCMACARRLSGEQQPCPVCQRPIERILRHFS